MKPFEYGCVVRGEVFCPRPEIESILTSNIVGGGTDLRRRMPKVSLMSGFETPPPSVPPAGKGAEGWFWGP